MRLYTKYRPRTWDEFVGNERLVRRVRAVLGRPDVGAGCGEALWISGPSGTGKTTIAHLVAAELGAPDWGIVELDGSACSVDEVRTLDDHAQRPGLFDVWRVWIVNESHAMTNRAVQAWLTLLERLPKRWLIIFTTTEQADADLFGQFTEPLMSRCKVFQLTSQGLSKPFAARAREIAQIEGLDGQPEAKYLRLVQDCHNNMRAVLQRIDAGEMME